MYRLFTLDVYIDIIVYISVRDAARLVLRASASTAISGHAELPQPIDPR